MDFKKIPTVLLPDEIIEISFKKAKKESRALSGKIPRRLRVKKSEATKVKTVSSFIRKHFGKVLGRTSELKKIDPFYQELIDLTVGTENLKSSLESLEWTMETVQKLEKKTLKRMRRSRNKEDIYKAREEFYGKVVSVLKKIEVDIELLNSSREKLKQLPNVESAFTVVVAGMPNVGKSTFVKCITSARPRIESYPFTTQQILLGYFEIKYRRYQVVDTPGLLDRPLDKRNKVEKQAILALRHLADMIIYLFDLSGVCGYPIQDQLKLYKEISYAFEMPVVPIINKSDLIEKEVVEGFSKEIVDNIFLCSSLNGEGVEEIVEMIVKEGSKKDQMNRFL
ncbi:MAG: NOG1 family protein [Candidatus Hydrothermarchaeales archaeon]